MNILLVEDRDEDRDLFLEYIEDIKSTKIDIQCANSINDAMSKMETVDFDLVFLDLGLRDSFGIETFKKMKILTDKINEKVQIVILTVANDYSVGKEAVKNGAFDFIIKGKDTKKSIERVINFCSYDKLMPRKKTSYHNKGIATYILPWMALLK